MNGMKCIKIYHSMALMLLIFAPINARTNNNAIKRNIKIDAPITLLEQEADEAVNRGFGSGSSCCGCGTCACCVKNVETICKVPTTISCPGVYCLNENLFATSCDLINALILTTTNDVMINLNGFTLSGGRRGIQINPNLHNIMIQNGAITNTDLEAVYVSEGNQVIQLTDLQIINANQSKCGIGIGGVAFAGTFANHVTDSLIKNVAVTDTIGEAFSLVFTDNTKILDSSALSILSTSAAFAIGFLINGDNNLLENDKAAHVLATAGGASSYGFLISGANSTTIKNCQASEVSSIAPAGDVFGFSVEFSSCTLLDHCISQDNSALPTAAMPLVATNAIGFRSIASSQTRFLECTACHNNSSVASIGVGFSLGGTLLGSGDTTDCISDCVSIFNTGDGFRVFGNCANCVTRFSKSLSNGGFGFNLTAANPTDIFYSNFAARNAAGNYNNIPNVNALGACYIPAPGCPACPACPAAEGDNINGNIILP